MNFALQALGVFAATAALDVVWAKYTYALTGKLAVRAGLYAGATFLLSGTATLGYTSSPWLLLPAIAGCFTGTYFVVRRHS